MSLELGSNARGMKTKIESTSRLGSGDEGNMVSKGTNRWWMPRLNEWMRDCHQGDISLSPRTEIGRSYQQLSQQNALCTRARISSSTSAHWRLLLRPTVMLYQSDNPSINCVLTNSPAHPSSTSLNKGHQKAGESYRNQAKVRNTPLRRGHILLIPNSSHGDASQERVLCSRSGIDGGEGVGYAPSRQSYPTTTTTAVQKPLLLLHLRSCPFRRR